MNNATTTVAQQGQHASVDSRASNLKSSIKDARLFSIVIATYNYGHLIERAIDSVLNQTCQDFELIVVDDGSTDETRQRVEQYGDRVRYQFKDNGGQSSAYNLGAELASGRFIYILDADDELLPNALERFSSDIRTQDQTDPCAIYYAGYVSVDSKGNEIEKRAVPAPTDPGKRLKRFLRRKITGLQNCTCAIPRVVFERFRYPESLRNNTDIVFFGQVIANHPAIRVDAVVARIHDHPLRTRKQLDKILATGTTPVDALFQPEMIPARLMRLRKLYLAQRLRSIARQCYIAGDFSRARSYYLGAMKAYPIVMLELASLKRFVIATLRG